MGCCKRILVLSNAYFLIKYFEQCLLWNVRDFVLCLVVTASLKVQPNPHEAESVLVNVAGRLLLFQRDRSGPQIKEDGKDRPVKSTCRSKVATYCLNLDNRT